MKKRFVLVLTVLLASTRLLADDGHRLWLPSDTVEVSSSVIVPKALRSSLEREQVQLAEQELHSFWRGKDAVQLSLVRKKTKGKSVDEGYSITMHNGSVRIQAGSTQGLLYGTYHLLRLQNLGADLASLNIHESPAYRMRILNHWDNADGTIERGYAGHSLWRWEELPAVISPRYREYARANASVGINATVLNNVNASPQILSESYLDKVRALADIFRPYGIRVFLSINFASPEALGGLSTADPLDSSVIAWWKDKVKEIYKKIPDFGGFLVKANSEGLPGPCDFGRTHAQGANMLADALKPYGGLVMWRAFVYSPADADRAKQAYLEFKPLDGQFHDNVIVQIKNGPVDFQPREPFSPLFGAMPATQQMVELQITQEYLGHSNHLAFLPTMWKECLEADTYQKGPGTTIAQITKSALHGWTAIAGVSNIGDEVNWCGHPFAQANWYAFGRLAWNPDLTSKEIAKEWLGQTFTNNPSFIEPVEGMMLESREAVVDYMMPLGLHHLFAWGHHYGPEPWCAVEGARPDWMPSYYHRADSIGLGFDRSSATGSDAVHQYHSPLSERFDSVDQCPDDYLLWFHHAGWDHRMHSGRTLWDELCFRYQRGLEQSRKFQKIWDHVESYVDSEIFHDVQRRLKIQTHDAQWWKDGCLLYFQQYSKKPFPVDYERPVFDLDYLKSIKLPITNYECPTREMLP